MRKLFVLLALLTAASQTQAELGFTTLTATTTSQTLTFSPAKSDVGICNYGAVIVYFRLFWEDETPAAATSAHNAIPAGSATAPYCVGVGDAGTTPAPWKHLTYISASSTATVTVTSE